MGEDSGAVLDCQTLRQNINPLGNNGGHSQGLGESPATRNRTRDHLIAAKFYSQMLYQLSYSRLDEDEAGLERPWPLPSGRPSWRGAGRVEAPLDRQGEGGR